MISLYVKNKISLYTIPDLHKNFKAYTLSGSKTCSSKASLTIKVLEGADRKTLVAEDINPSRTIKLSLANSTKYTKWELTVELRDTST